MKLISLLNRKWIGCCLAIVLTWAGFARSSPGQSGIYLLDNVPVQAGTPAPPSLGQQPFPVEKEPDLTPSQTNTHQLNQLFQIETTPDICAAGEGYIAGNFDYLKFPGSTKEYRLTIQGQYGITDQIAAGAFIPIVTTRTNTTSTGVGDIGIYGQYKLDQVINPEIVDVTAQLDVILPTGDTSRMRDTGKFGVRPVILAYKDFGQQGPGILGVYGSFGFTLTTNPDVRTGIAVTYQYESVVGMLELYDLAGDLDGRPLVQVTPGLSYRGISPWEISVGVPIGINKGTPDWGVIFKLTYVFAN